MQPWSNDVPHASDTTTDATASSQERRVNALADIPSKSYPAATLADLCKKPGTLIVINTNGTRELHEVLYPNHVNIVTLRRDTPLGQPVTLFYAEIASKVVKVVTDASQIHYWLSEFYGTIRTFDQLARHIPEFGYQLQPGLMVSEIFDPKVQGQNKVYIIDHVVRLGDSIVKVIMTQAGFNGFYERDAHEEGGILRVIGKMPTKV